MLSSLSLLSADANAAPVDEGDLVTLDGGLAQITLMGLLQVHAAPFVQDDALVDNGDPADQAGFRLRRARFGFTGVAYGMIDFELSAQATHAKGMDVLDAWVGYRGLTSLSFFAGARKVPYSRFALESASRTALADRAYAVRAMAPFRQLGITVEGDIGAGIANFAVGVYNGFARAGNFHEGYTENAALAGNRFTRLAYVARIEAAPMGPVGATLADLDGGSMRIGIGGGMYFDHGETVETLGIEADLVLKVSGFHLAAEFLYDDATPADEPTSTGTIPSAVTRMAVVSQLGYLIVPERLGATARIEWIDDNTELDNAGDQLIATIGMQYYFRRHHLKASLEFTHREELSGLSIDNDSLMLQAQFSL